jgi:Holliday junction resolvasome RuvABC endonuclease subunit
MSALLFAADPSIRCCGWNVFDIDTAAPIAAGAIVTASHVGPDAYSLEKQKDAAENAGRIFDGIRALLDRHRPDVFALETPLGSQDAIAAALMARAHTAVVLAIRAWSRSDRPIYVSSYGAKWAATGTKKPKDAKGDVRRAVIARWGRELWDRLLRDVTTDAAREAAYDASAVALLALRLPQVRALRSDQQIAPPMNANEGRIP